MDNVEDIYALSPVQQGILFHCISAPSSGVYHEQLTCQLTGELDPELFAQAWQLVFDRHPALRTIFLWEDIEEPLQVVRQSAALPWRHEDWSDHDQAQQEDLLRTFLLEDRLHGLDLTSAPLSRMLLAKTNHDAARFVWSFHHLLLDGWSTPLVFREALENYDTLRQDRNPSPPASPFFRGYIAWLQALDETKVKSFWKDQLAGFTSPNRLRLYNDASRHDGSPRHELSLSAELSKTLKSRAKDHRLTLNTILHGAWALLLHHCTGDDDLVFGTTVSGRPSRLAGVEQMIGCCINTLPIRIKIDRAARTADWLTDLQNNHIALREHEGSSLSAIQSWSEVPSGTALFESIVVFENYPVQIDDSADSGRSLHVSDLDIHEQSNFPLALLVVPGDDSIRLLLAYDQSLFAPSTTARLLRRLQTILQSMATNLEDSLAAIAWIPTEESSIVADWSLGPPLPPNPALAPDLTAQQAASRPDHPAILFKEQTLSRADLDCRSSAVAAALQRQGCRPGQSIALSLDRSPEMIIAIVAIHKIGCAYVPLDPAYPNHRLQYMLDDSGAVLLLTRPDLADGLTAPKRLSIENLSLTPEEDEFTPTPIDPESLAYIIYTSGSTGQPKGVGVTHRNLAASLAARSEHYEQPPDRFLLLSSFSFDSSMVGIFWTICSGGTLVLPGDKEEQDLELVAKLIDRHHITHTLCLPTLYDLLLANARADQLQSLRVVIMAGEECPLKLLQRHRDTLPACELHNEYGPTEATVWSSVWKLTDQIPTSLVPIGRPIAGTRLHVLDHDRNPLPVDVPGELHVGGAGITPGYFNRPDLTEERFISPPFDPQERLYCTGDRVAWQPDGNLVFLGRMDGQVKIRGHRLELGEIEATLSRHPAISECAAFISHRRLFADVDSLTEALAQLTPAAIDSLFANLNQ